MVNLDSGIHFDGIVIDDKIGMYHTSIGNLLGLLDKLDRPYFVRTSNYIWIVYGYLIKNRSGKWYICIQQYLGIEVMKMKIDFIYCGGAYIRCTFWKNNN